LRGRFRIHREERRQGVRVENKHRCPRASCLDIDGHGRESGGWYQGRFDSKATIDSRRFNDVVILRASCVVKSSGVLRVRH